MVVLLGSQKQDLKDGSGQLLPHYSGATTIFQDTNLKNESTQLKENVKNPYWVEDRNVRLSVQRGTSIDYEI
jgi:hypothetical protein